jgi:hypothetical protein
MPTRTIPKRSKPKHPKTAVGWNDPSYRYTGNSRQRILRTPDSEPIIAMLQAHYCTPMQSPILKLALRHLAARGPDPEQLAFVRANPTAHGDCKESSWSGQQSEMEVIRRFAGKLDIRHRDVLRMALRQLAASEGLLQSP